MIDDDEYLSKFSLVLTQALEAKIANIDKKLLDFVGASTTYSGCICNDDLPEILKLESHKKVLETLIEAINV